MSDPEKGLESFLQRWSRRKHATATRPREGSGSPGPEDVEARPSHDTVAQGGPALPPFDPATLPPIDSITATSDIRAFLAPGVPDELARAALRRAWLTDPTIRDFVGLAENQGDFTKPDGVPGFGSLELTPELRRMVARLVGEPLERPPPPAGSEPDKPIADVSKRLPATRPVCADNGGPEPSDPQLVLRRDNDDAATQTESREAAEAPGPVNRRHGGAMPK